ncbi:MAG: hypothetical protein LBE35_06760 [Clostridiales bacterium]|jgi:hypothetical protein|nr:hypothetical protein [Clostridiales bacterium]
MNKYYEEYEGLYEKAYEAMEMGEKLEGILHALEGIGDILGKLLEQRLEERGQRSEKEQKSEIPAFKIGADLGEAKLQEDAIARAFGNA